MSRVAHHTPAYADLRGQFRRSYHLEMISDRDRVRAIRDALDQVLGAEDVFCEVGCGTGIFAIEAAKRCSRVYAIEVDDAMAELAGENVARAGVADRVHLITGDATEVELPERVDVVLCEMMSIWAVEEPIVPVANRVRADLLKPEGLFLPSRIVNLVELAWFPYWHGGVSIPAVAPLFPGIPRPQVVTESRTCGVLDFSGPVDPDLSVDVELEAVVDGRVNAAVLRSVVQMGGTAVFSGSDSLMPPTVVPLDREVVVRSGMRLRLTAELQARGALLDRESFRVERV